jgi:hypothetical protein
VRKKLLLLLVALAFALGLPACGSDDGEDSPGSPPAATTGETETDDGGGDRDYDY